MGRREGQVLINGISQVIINEIGQRRCEPTEELAKAAKQIAAQPGDGQIVHNLLGNVDLQKGENRKVE
jgi:hypothetical protein